MSWDDQNSFLYCGLFNGNIMIWDLSDENEDPNNRLLGTEQLEQKNL